MSSSSSSAGARREGLRASTASSSSRRSSSSDVAGRSNGQAFSGRRRSSTAASASSTSASSTSASSTSASSTSASSTSASGSGSTVGAGGSTSTSANAGAAAVAATPVGPGASESGSAVGAGAPSGNGTGSGSQAASGGGQAPGARASEDARSTSSTGVVPSTVSNSRVAGGGSETGPTRGTKRARTGELPGEGRKESTDTRAGASAGGKGTGKVSSTPASREKWNKYTHHAMVRILSNIWQDLDDRRTSEVLDVETDETLSKFLQRIQDIGQEMTAFSMSNLQTHSLIDSTVQLCYRMAADPACRLAKGYPVDATSKDDIFDAETADSALSSESDWESNSSSDSDSDWAQGTYKSRAKGSGRGGRMSDEGRRRRSMSGETAKLVETGATSSNSLSNRSSPSVSGSGTGVKTSAGMDSSSSSSLPSPSSMSSSPMPEPGASGGAAVSEASSSSIPGNSAQSNGIPGSDGDKGSVNNGNGVDTISQGRARRASRGVTRADGTTVSGGANGWKRAMWGGKGKGKKVASGKRGARKSPIDVRERFTAAVTRLAKNCEWAKERLGKPRKDVLVKGQETLMAIFVDSFYSRKLSEKRINLCLEKLENAITWAEGLSDSGTSPPKYVLDWALRLSEVGLDHISLTAAE